MGMYNTANMMRHNLKSRYALAARRAVASYVAPVAAPAQVAVNPRVVEQNAAEARVKAGGTCCTKSIARLCVCTRSTNCPDHGAICVGSHE